MHAPGSIAAHQRARRAIRNDRSHRFSVAGERRARDQDETALAFSERDIVSSN
jgi:hypothetical protein